jgi:hypothetical protein
VGRRAVDVTVSLDVGNVEGVGSCIVCFNGSDAVIGGVDAGEVESSDCPVVVSVVVVGPSSVAEAVSTSDTEVDCVVPVLLPSTSCDPSVIGTALGSGSTG